MATSEHTKRRNRSIAFPLALAGTVVILAVFGALYLTWWRDTTPHVLYKAFYSEGGWNAKWSTDGDTCGVHTSGKPIQALRMELENMPVGASILYAGFVQGLGWKEAKNGLDIIDIANTGQVRGIEALKASLEGAPGYMLQYRAHFPQAGWTEWLEDGILVGAPKSGDLMDAFQVRLAVADSVVAVFEAKQGVQVDFSDIYFAVGSDRFNFDVPQTAHNLARLYKFLQQSCDSLTVGIEGHSSAEGDPAANQALSEERAAKVRQWLVSKGVPAGKIVSTKGFGSSQPKVPEPPAGSVSAAELENIRKQNRRIAVRIERGCQ